MNRAALNGSQDDGLREAKPMMIAAANLVLHAVRGGAFLVLGAIHDAEKLMGHATGDEALLTLWCETILA